MFRNKCETLTGAHQPFDRQVGMMCPLIETINKQNK